jgi:hypothetical protein
VLFVSEGFNPGQKTQRVTIKLAIKLLSHGNLADKARNYFMSGDANQNSRREISLAFPNLREIRENRFSASPI